MSRIVVDTVWRRERNGRVSGGVRSRPRAFYLWTLALALWQLPKSFMAGWEATTDEAWTELRRRACPHTILYKDGWCLDCGQPVQPRPGSAA